MMHHHAAGFNPLLRQRDCVQCPAQAPACACGAGFDCVLTSETCDACPEAQCVAQAHKSSGGVGKGAMAGAVVAVLAFLFLVVGGFLWWRRRSSKRRMAAASREKAIENVPGVTVGPGSPSPANNNRFSRPLDAYEKAPASMENPFESNDSIRSGGGLSAHSIPIGIASEGQLSPNAVSPTGTTFAGVPIRPARSPDLNIRATPFDGNGTLQPPRPNYAPSQRTDFTTSTMDSTASSAMEALYESPTIVTGVKRTVISAGRGEVVPVTDLNSNPNSPRGSAPLRRTGQPGPSPLAASHFSRSTLAPMLEEDPFADDGMSVRTQSTSMTNMSFGMGTPTASIRSFAQPTVASRVNVASLARSATLRSLGAPSVAPSSASHQILEHPLSQDNTDAYPPTRRGSVDSFASNTDSVLASFPFVPPSPLPTSSSRSPLSVVFTPSSMNRQSNGSSMFGTERSSEDTPPPLPNTYDIAALSEGAVRTSTAGASSSSTPASQPQQQSRPRFAGAAMMAARDSTMSSGTSGGLDDFDFQFAPGSEDPTPHTSSQPQLRSDSSTLPKSEPTSLSSRPQASPPSMPAAVSEHQHQHQRSESRASLDLLALSRDLAANKLSYD